MRIFLVVVIFFSIFLGCVETTLPKNSCDSIVCDERSSCQNGVCILDLGRCNSNSDCSENQICNESKWCENVVITNPCDSIECSAWESCQNGACVLDLGRCNSNSDCSENQICNESKWCENIVITNPCDSIVCNSWESCQNGVCVLDLGRCNSNGDCSENQICNESKWCENVVSSSWIGSFCSQNEQCDYSDGFCFENEISNFCSMSCTRLCPDLDGFPTTFCIENPDDGGGICVSQCDFSIFSETGCSDGLSCVSKERYQDSSVVRDVCLYQTEEPLVCTETTFTIENIGVVEPNGVDGCPLGMTPIYDSSVCIDRWEAFVVEIDSNGDEIPFSPYKNPGTTRIKAKSAPNATPQGYINEIQAKAACENAGKRLCSLNEWMLACQGEQGYTYPYGNVRVDGVCNDARAVHPVVEFFGTSADWIWSKLGHPCINQQNNTVTLTGEKSDCISDVGAYDMMGNLHEWIDDSTGVFKGGYYVDTYRNGNGCLYKTTAHNTLHWDYSTGFRCCADIE